MKKLLFYGFLFVSYVGLGFTLVLFNSFYFYWLAFCYVSLSALSSFFNVVITSAVPEVFEAFQSRGFGTEMVFSSIANKLAFLPFALYGGYHVIGAVATVVVLLNTIFYKNYEQFKESSQN